MSVESLKRVLAKIKGDARSMRKGHLESRIKPKEEPKPEPVLLEGSDAEEALETPDMETAELGDDGDEVDATKPPKKDAKAAEIAAIKKLLARS